MEQNIKARIVLARGTPEKYGEKTILKKNEVVLVDIEKDDQLIETKVKIGDGNKKFNELPYVLGNVTYYNEEPVDKRIGDMWYDSITETYMVYSGEHNITLSHVIKNIEDGLGDKSIQTTDSSTAGSMCFKFDKEKTHTQNEFYLSMTDEQKQKEFNVANKKFSMKLDNNFDYAGVATSLENGVLKVQTLTATHNGALAIPGTAGVGALAIDEDSFLFFPGEPDLGTDILGEGAVALGVDTKAQSNAAFAEGRQTVSAGQYAHAEGRRTNAIGYSSHAEGVDTKAIGQRTHAEGDNTIAEGYGSHAQGQKTEAIGKQSHAEGVESVAKGDQSHAEGLNTYTQGQGAHSEGIRTAAIGLGAHAEGRASTEPLGTDGNLQSWNKNAGLSIAEGEASHIEGIHTHTGPDAHGAHAEGELTEATGANAHAEGKETQAAGEASHAEGIGTIAHGIGQHVQGKYNEIDEHNDYAHIVGNGNNHYERLNVHTLDWDGNAWYAGSIEAKQGIFKSTEGTVNLTNGYITASNNITANREIQSDRVVTNEISSQEISNTQKITTKDFEFTGTLSSNSSSSINLPNADLTVNSIQSFGLGGIGEAGNVYGSSLSIKDNDNNNVASIDNEGKGKFNSLVIKDGEKEYPVLNYIGAGEILPNAAKEGDIFRIPSKRIEIEKNTIIQCSNSMIDGCRGGFKGKLYSSNFIVPSPSEDEDLNRCILTFTNTDLYQKFRVYTSSAVQLDFKDRRILTLAIIDTQYPEEKLQILVEGITANEMQEEYLNKYNNFYLYGVNDGLNNFELEASLKGTAPLSDNTLFNYIIKLIKNVYPINDELLLNTGGMYQLNPAVRFICSWADYISYGEFVITAIGFDGETYYITYDEDSGPWGDFMNQDAYQTIGSPQLTALNYIYNSETTYYIYSQDFGWESLGEGTNLLNPVTGNSNIPLIGYSEYCKYQVTEKDDLPSILEKAVEDGNTLLYIEEGEYNGLTYILPYSNLQIIGLGRVVFNFKIYEPVLKSLQQTQTYNFHNIVFNNTYEHQGLTVDNNDIITAVLNEVNFIQCEIRKSINVGSGKFINCSIYNSIDNVISSVYTMASSYDNSNFYFNQSNMKSYILWANSIENCNFYIGKNVETIIIKDGFYSLPYIYNNNFYITTRNCQMQTTTLETRKIIESNFLQYPFSNIEIIDEETCYISSSNNVTENDLSNILELAKSYADKKIIYSTNIPSDDYVLPTGTLYIVYEE